MNRLEGYKRAADANSNVKKPTGARPKSVEANAFEQTVNNAIKTLENSMRGTCAKEMETSISVTASGEWVVGVSITGSMRLVIANPELPQNCRVK